MTINQTNMLPDLIELGYSNEEAYYYANQAYSDWVDKTKMGN